MSLIKYSSPFITSRLPGVISYQYPNFIAFLKAYFEYLETNGQVIANVNNFLSNRDIDTTLDSFISHFQNTFIKNIPESVLCNKKLLIKHIRDFYKTRGTEESFKFLFRILYNDDIEITYPKENLLKPSDGIWNQNFVLRTTTNNDTFQFIGNVITGIESNASAIVENVLQLNLGNNNVSEIYISHIKGNFKIGESVKVLVDPVNNTYLQENLFTLITKINIINPGTRYNVNDLIPIVATNGINATAKIQSTFGNIYGIVVNSSNTTIVNPGQSNEFTILPNIVLDQTASATDDFYTGMQILLRNGPALNDVKTIIAYNGASRTATVNSDWNVLPQPGNNFSISLGEIRKLVIQDFGIGYTQNNLPVPNFSQSGDGNATATVELGVVGEYPGYFSNTKGFLSSVNVLPDGTFWQDYSYVIHAQESISLYKDIVKQLVHPAGMIFFGQVDFFLNYIIGSQNRNLERNKFFFPPYEGFTPDSINGSFPNTQLFGFDNLIIGDIQQYPYRLLKQIPDAYIKSNIVSGGTPAEILAEYDCLSTINYTGTLGALYGISQYRNYYYRQSSNITISDETSSNILKDVKTTPGPKYDGVFGGYQNNYPTYIRGLDIKFNNSNEFIDISQIPVNPLEQTILVAFKTYQIGTKQSIVGCIDFKKDGIITGYTISILEHGQVEFRSQKRNSTQTFNLTITTPLGSIIENTYYIACLRFVDNTLIGNLNLSLDLNISYGFDISQIGILNNSSGYYLGNQGKIVPYSVSSLYDTSFYGRTPYGHLRPIPSTSYQSNTLFGKNTFNTDPYLGNPLVFTPEITTNAFFGEIAYVMFWNKYLLDNDYNNTFRYVQSKLSSRGMKV